MKSCSAVLVTADMARSVAFYKEVLGLDVIEDFGANKTLTGGLALQTLESYQAFIGGAEIFFGGRCFELYFEEEDFDAFAAHLASCAVRYVHPVKEHSWGQRVVRFYDPDQHILEVGEAMPQVCRRFRDAGMTLEQIAGRMDVPVAYVSACLAEG